MKKCKGCNTLNYDFEKVCTNCGCSLKNAEEFSNSILLSIKTEEVIDNAEKVAERVIMPEQEENNQEPTTVEEQSEITNENAENSLEEKQNSDVDPLVSETILKSKETTEIENTQNEEIKSEIIESVEPLVVQENDEIAYPPTNVLAESEEISENTTSEPIIPPTENITMEEVIAEEKAEENNSTAKNADNTENEDTEKLSSENDVVAEEPVSPLAENVDTKTKNNHSLKLTRKEKKHNAEVEKNNKIMEARGEYKPPKKNKDSALKEFKKVNRKFIPVNIIALALCAVAIITMFMGSFFKFKIKAEIDFTKFDLSVFDEIINSESGEESANISNYIDPTDLGKVAIKIDVDIKTKQLMEVAKGKNKTLVSDLIDKEIDEIFTSIDPVIDKLALIFSKAAINYAIANSSANIPVEDQDKQLEGITENLESFINGDKTADALWLDVVAYIDANFTDLSPTEKEDLTADVKESYDFTIDTITDESGKFSPFKAVELLVKEEGDGALTEEEIKQKFKDKINNAIDKVLTTERLKTINKVVKIISYVYLGIIAVWAYTALKLIIKTLFLKRKKTKLVAPRILGTIPHVLLVGIPMLAILIAGKGLIGPLENALKDVDALAKFGIDLKQIINSIKFSNTAFYAAACSFGILILTFATHGIRKKEKKLRKEYKYFKGLEKRLKGYKKEYDL